MTQKSFVFFKEEKSTFFRLSKKELVSEFKKWITTKDISFIYNRDCINCFITEAITSDDSENNSEQYSTIKDILTPTINKYKSK